MNCKQCGEEIVKTTYPCGQVECNKHLKNRKFCNSVCFQENHTTKGELFLGKKCEQCEKDLVRSENYTSGVEKISMFNKRRFCSDLCRSHNHREGDQLKPRSSRQQSRKFAKKSCEVCGTPEKEKRMEVNYINKDVLNNDPKNLITLCASCSKYKRSPYCNLKGKTIERVLCKEQGCDRHAKKKLMCRKHYMQKRRQALKQKESK